MIYTTQWKTREGKSRQIWLYGVWASMKQRCFNPNASNYHNYGGRGIRVCNIWMADFLAFRKWAIDSGYRKGLQIDRVDNDGNYLPNNCKWSTVSEQALNRRNTGAMHVSRNKGMDNPAAKVTPEQAANILIDKRPQTEIAKDYGISQQTVSRVKNSDYWKSDWRVAGALIEAKMWGCNLVRKGDEWEAHVVPIGQIKEYIARNESPTRAIIEACVEALS